MRLFVYDMSVNVNVIYYVHVCEQARWARSAGNSAIDNLCIIYYYYYDSTSASLKRNLTVVIPLGGNLGNWNGITV